ncbi:PAS domain S-box-containing protein [Desulfobaculum xiamenense]|uniref:histidine kinase n=1 Tax=Desulfobaculum xiamenense TaxID=995050 RepID=A0A846QS12_9BACT|nr:ATP-binding protein [Desulfobaculum xiamenense]NJB69322.1 PAS domain S-box-containing protein [Desulfobaculum xiamenense]
MPVKRIRVDRALVTVLVYAVFGFAWILFSDWALEMLVPDPRIALVIQTWKGWLFVLVTALLLYGMIRRNFAALRTSERQAWILGARLRSVMDSMACAVIAIDADGRVVAVNTVALAMAERDEEALGADVFEAFAVLEPCREQLALALSGRRPPSVRLESSGGVAPRHLVAESFPLAGGEGGAVLRVDDVTEQVRLESMMAQTEKMISVGGLASGMAHEINNPLSGIVQGAQNIMRRLDPLMGTNAEVAERLGVPVESVRGYLEERGVLRMLDGIRESALRAARIVSNMLDFARRSDSSPVPCDLNAVVAGAVELASGDYSLRRGYDFLAIEIVREFADPPPPVCCHRSELEQVVFGLLKNAAQAMTDAGTANPRIVLRTGRRGEWGFLEVEDNGPGMPPEVQRRVFEPFYTTKPPGEGTGMGLSVAYFIIVRNHGGQFQVETRPGQGARFTVLLPILEPDECHL